MDSSQRRGSMIPPPTPEGPPKDFETWDVINTGTLPGNDPPLRSIYVSILNRHNLAIHHFEFVSKSLRAKARALLVI